MGRVLRKALATPDLDDLSVISSAWIRFERCHGTLDQLKSCQEQCAARLYQEQVQNTHNLRDKLPKSGKKPAAKRTATIDRPSQAKRTKKYEDKSANAEASTGKKAKPLATEPLQDNPTPAAAIDTANDHLTIFLSNLAYK